MAPAKPALCLSELSGPGTLPATKFEECFPHRICINLARRADRWTKAQTQFRQHKIEVSRWEAVDGSRVEVPSNWVYAPGAYGCLRSHLSAVQEAAARGCESLLIFEDDVELHPQFRALFSHFMSQVPADWDALYFGGIHRSDPVPLAENVVRLQETNSTFAYVLRKSIFKAFIELNEAANAPVDEVMKTLQCHFNFYCSLPHLAWVSRDYSDVLGAEVNHWWLQEGLVLDGSEVETQARETSGLILPPTQETRFSREALELMLPPICSLLPEVLVLASPADRGALAGLCIPPTCRIIYDERGIAFGASALTQEAIGLFRSNCKYFFVCAADTYVSCWELQAALHQCLDHELVSPGEVPVELTVEDTRKALEHGGEKVDTSPYPRTSSPSSLSGFFIISRRALTEAVPFADIAASGLKAFRCPSRPLRLRI
ncbi:MAG TPA: glycosyltransferase family 25 protein [Candidatus Angelobacter sp.]|nr:glycosyltransferase family 25 protein [Candidatus Angelobacter sp.]